MKNLSPPFLLGGAVFAALAYMVEPFFFDPRITVFIPIAFVGVASTSPDPLRAVLTGASAGIVMDLLHGGPLGVYAGSLSALGYALARIHRYFLLDHAAFRVGAVAIGTAIFFPASFVFGAFAGVDARVAADRLAVIVALSAVCLGVHALTRAANSLRVPRS